MTPHQTIAVAVRLFAVWLLISLITGLITFASEFDWQTYPTKGWAMASIAGVIILVVVGLWLFPLTLARQLLSSPEPQPGQEARSTSPDTWLAMGCALVGLWVLTTSLPALIRDLVILKSSDFTADTSSVQNWLIYDLGQLLLAVWLLFGARGFRRIFWWARTVGIGESSTNRSSEP